MNIIATLGASALLSSLALLPMSASAQNTQVSNAWARATAPGQTTAGVYFEVTSATNAALVAIASPVAARAELHSTTLDHGVMRMRPLARLDLPAGETVKLSPNGVHVMLVDLKTPLKEGKKVPLVLSIQSSGKSPTRVDAVAEVRAFDGSGVHSH